MARHEHQNAGTVRTLLALSLASAFATSACLDTEAPSGPLPTMCDVQEDCDSANGEICDEGVCWGDPPNDTVFAAVLVPPEDRPDLVRTELPRLRIAQDGYIDGLVFAEQVTLKGRVLLACAVDATMAECDPSRSIAASIRVRRASAITGGPDFSLDMEATAGVVPGDTAFELHLPKLSGADGDEPYEIQVVPLSVKGGGTEGAVDPAALAPPAQIVFDGLDDDLDATWELGEPLAQKILSGRVVDAAGRGVAGMQVAALGRWTLNSPMARGSSLSVTDGEGYYALRVPLAMLDVYDLVAIPQGDLIAPTLRIRGVVIADPPSGGQIVPIADLRIPSHPQPTTFVVPVRGADTAGTEVAVAGATVELATVFDSPPGTTAIYIASGTTDSSGEVELQLIPGGNENREYLARVLPPPTASHASISDKVVSVGTGTAGSRSVLSQIALEKRVMVAGQLVNADGEPVAGATVNTRASLALKLAQSLSVQSDLDNLQYPTATTDGTGNFTLWLDPDLLGIIALYDVAFVPPAGAAAPRWSLEDLSLTDLTPASGLVIPLPAPAFARGPVTSPGGDDVEGAELWLYQLRPDDGLCDGANLPLGDICEPEALLRGLWRSRPKGQVWIVLPDPDGYISSL